jgi:hypothetical protein
MSDEKVIKFFDMNKMKDNFRMVSIGLSGSGKSKITRDILYAKKNVFPTCQIFSESESIDPFYSNFVPQCCIYPSFKESAISLAFDRAKRAKQKNLNNYNHILVFDDVVTDSKTLNKESVKKLFKFGRHFNLSMTVALQGVMDLTSNFRNLIDYVFIFTDSTLITRKKLYNFYVSSLFDDEAEFSRAMDIATENFTALIIDNTSKSNKFSDRVFYYRSDLDAIPKDWKFGCETLWDYNSKKLDKNA